MDMPWGDERTVKFITNVGLVTSTGPHGDNVMACEWTHHVSYSPGLVAVCLGHKKATVENIRATREFGVSLASTGQTVLVSIAGNTSGRETHKIAALEEMGFSFHQAKHIRAPLVTDAALVMECKLVQEIILGDHIMFVGEILDATAGSQKPLAYHHGTYFELTTALPKPDSQERELLRKIVGKHKK